MEPARAGSPDLSGQGYDTRLMKPSPYRSPYRTALLAITLLVFSATILLSTPLMAAQDNAPQCGPSTAEVVAAYIAHDLKLDAGHPAPEWKRARDVSFCTDWQGKNPDPGRETKVRVLWSDHTLYLRFETQYRDLFLFDDSDANGRRDHLWDRDVAEAFLQPHPAREHYYREFEVSPNGMWIDLDIFPGGLADLKSGLQRSVFLNRESRTWAAELAIPFTALTSHFDPTAIWRANFYRIEGTKEPRTYLAWQATRTPEPNFHVPSAFGTLRFEPSPAK
jgi:alpha-galactosidase